LKECAKEVVQPTDTSEAKRTFACNSSITSDVLLTDDKEGLNLYKIPGQDQESEEELIEEEQIPDWIRCSPADVYFKRDKVIVRFLSHLVLVACMEVYYSHEPDNFI
jgi:hypothetical protein